MPKKLVSVYQNGGADVPEAKRGPVVTVTEDFAKSIGATVLEDESPVDLRTGRPLPPREAGVHLVEKTSDDDETAEKPPPAPNPRFNPPGGAGEQKKEDDK